MRIRNLDFRSGTVILEGLAQRGDSIRHFSLSCCAQHKKLYVIRRTMLSGWREATRGAGFRAPELT